MMRRAGGAAAICALVLLFLIANRGAYQGYFQDDELDNISWTIWVPAKDYLRGLLSPLYSSANFRPVGHGWFAAMGGWAGLRFPPYVAAIHALHFVNILLVWLLMRRLSLGRIPAAAGAAFYAFHMGVFDALWKPMYVFDLLCALFSLASLVAWTRRRWVLSFIAFWLAYKAKELAVMLPLALAAYELWLSQETGRRRWLRLAPFFAVSVSFGLQAIWFRHPGAHAYRMELSLATLPKTVPFYAERVFLVPWAGLAVLALPLVIRDRRVWFGAACLALFAAPLILLPGRVFAAYLYLPLAGLAVALAASLERAPRWAPPLVLLVWIPWNYHHLRLQRRAALTVAGENRAYVGELFRVAAAFPNARTFVYDGAPAAMARWGVEGALRFHFKNRVELLSVDDQDLARAAAGKELVLLSWDPAGRRITEHHRRAGEPPAPYVRMDASTPVWQLVSGWLPRTGYFRWTRPEARAVVSRPAGARRFELVVNAGPPYIAEVKKGVVEVYLDGVLAGRAEFSREGWQTVAFELAPAPPAEVEVTFRARPEIRVPPGNPAALGVPIGAFGFPAPESRSSR